MDIQNITVIGAGNMGSGIAQSWAQAGFSVKMHDVSAEAIERGRSRIEAPLRKRVEAGKMPAKLVDATMANLHAEPDFDAAVANADLVIEAVFEDLKVKQDLFTRLDAACPTKTVLATNTSSFAVADLAKVTQRPANVVGLHYFFPAAINKLVEVIGAKETDRAVFDAVYAAVTKTGKLAIETGDASGFCVNRFFVPWINESCRILEEGLADIPTIEAAAKDAFQITMGPFELMNVTGVPISLHAQATLHEAFGAFYAPSEALRAQVDAGKNWDLTGEADASKAALVAARLRGVVFGIACHLTGEGVATIRDTDRGATIGLRWAKGPFAMMNALGTDQAATEVRAMHATWGDAFPMPKELESLNGNPWHLPAVTLTRDRDVATITFDRPEALNALDATVLGDLSLVLDALEKEPARAVVVTGMAKAFIAGADIPTMKALDADGATAYTELGNRVLNRLAGLPCPVLMAINGYAFGGGLELALCGDLLYASDKALLGLPEVGLGIHPGFGGTQRLPRRVGIGTAKELIFRGNNIDAHHAKQIGLVNDVFAHEQLLETVQGIAKEIAQKAPLAVQGAKQAMDRGMGMDIAGGLHVEQESVVLLFASKDKDEGLGAFLERRKPAFTGQ